MTANRNMGYIGKVFFKLYHSHKTHGHLNLQGRNEINYQGKLFCFSLELIMYLNLRFP